ncbi:D-glycero-beta-D-manno-heptose 1-phosphate adenylyltransferase [Actinophytocola xanthii]|uniref:D-glycero-beta-D-manno-heptose 1-phosphate adenylyltransferase n=1 Tax=Actinophytocola xanthii TaxID=1912961 RepID=A0A1Q8C6K1_9PSEU|nr:D-glycero-beta-D-manno-heptose 1-phosphate adenylyltransferase [Actinophytocola xanthii]OLF09989.1 bifunctional heptose 7-phosphate kinase/heptose 1-phosphate adenyltransferase [Actinophytocola xanthii]
MTDTMPLRQDGLPELTADLPARLAELAPRVLVVGDVILDEWLSGSADRLCREAPAPVVAVAQRRVAPGGAANTAVNLAALGARVRMVSAVGADDAGTELLAALRQSGVDTELVAVEPDRRTTTKSRVVADDQVLVRLDDGDRDQAPLTAVPAAIDRFLAACAEADAVVLCDYGTGLLSGDVLERLLPTRERIPLLVVDAHHPRRWARLRPDIVTPNAEEAATVLDTPIPRSAAEQLTFLDENRAQLLERTGARAAAVTLDRDGAVLLDGDRPVHRTWARPAPDNHTAGAGDTFCAALTVARCAGLPAVVAVELAQAAADVVVHRPETAVCSATDLAERLGLGLGSVLDHDRLAEIVAEHRAAGRRIVFTNGCFDVLHPGHVNYLNEAKRLGDVLVVAVNSDAGVARLKGPDRPVNGVADRAAVLAGLSCVDHLTVFDEDTPAALLARLRPEIYAKGGDHREELLSEAAVVREYGGRVRILSYLPDRSTSALIDRIRGR